MRDFRALKVWHRSHRLAVSVNLTLARIRRRGFAHVISQGQRAAFSIAATIVEGCGHDSDREFVRFLRMSLASANELEYHLLAAFDLSLLPAHVNRPLEEETQAVKRMLYASIGHMRGGGAA